MTTAEMMDFLTRKEREVARDMARLGMSGELIRKTLAGMAAGELKESIIEEMRKAARFGIQ